VKRTRKWAFVAQEAAKLGELGLSPREIAIKLGLNKSTVTRWIAAGKLKRHEAQAPAARAVAEGVWRDKTPAEWAAAVREDYDLSETDDQLVTLAESALLVGRDPLSSASTRLNAMGRFQALVKQLGLETRSVVPLPDEAPVEPASPVKAAPVLKRTGTDPRGILMGLN
jgi:hypothetical protein